VGEPIAGGVLSVFFSGRFGLARTPDGLYAFGADGRLVGPIEAAGDQPLPPPLVAEGGQLILRRTDGPELRTNLAGPVLSIEQMGEDWFHVRQEDRSLAVRVKEDRLEIYRLPEARP
jgi:hypothetical protein